MRFWNDEVLKNIESVLERIWVALDNDIPLSPGPSPARGEGEKK
jgi:hypothetical protein